MAKKAMVKQLVAVVPQNLYNKVASLADNYDRSKGEVIRTALSQYVEKFNANNTAVKDSQ